MEITNSDQLLHLTDGNKFKGTLPQMTNSHISFYGSNNVLVCEDDVQLEKCNITFSGNDSIIYLSSNRTDMYKPYGFNLIIYSQCKCFFGKNCKFNIWEGQVGIIRLNEHTNLFVGDDCLFSDSYSIETGDGHLIYDLSTGKRINQSKSIYLGDHVWLTHGVNILKNTTINSGCVIGKNSVIASKKTNVNECWAGNPAKLVRSNIAWLGTMNHSWTNKDTNDNDYKPDLVGYKEKDFNEIELKLNELLKTI